MSLKVQLTFDEIDKLTAISLARLLLDIQHLAVVIVSPLAEPDQAILYDPWRTKYSVMIETRGDSLGPAQVEIIGLSYGSPLQIKFLLKVAGLLVKPTAQLLRTAADRLFFYDIQRRERTIAADIKAEELRRHRIDNFAKAVKLESIIRDPELRKKYVEGLYNSITPFEDQHPRITSISIDEADESTGASKTKMAGAD